MERLLKMSLREFRRSRKTIPMKKTITTRETTNEKGEKVKIRVEKWKKHQIGRKGFLDSAAKASHETTVLAAGWLGASWVAIRRPSRTLTGPWHSEGTMQTCTPVEGSRWSGWDVMRKQTGRSGKRSVAPCRCHPSSV